MRGRKSSDLTAVGNIFIYLLRGYYACDKTVLPSAGRSFRLQAMLKQRTVTSWNGELNIGLIFFSDGGFILLLGCFLLVFFFFFFLSNTGPLLVEQFMFWGLLLSKGMLFTEVLFYCLPYGCCCTEKVFVYLFKGYFHCVCIILLKKTYLLKGCSDLIFFFSVEL